MTEAQEKPPLVLKEARITPEKTKEILKSLSQGGKTLYDLRFVAHPLGATQLKNTLNVLEGLGLVDKKNETYRGIVETRTIYELSKLGKQALKKK